MRQIVEPSVGHPQRLAPLALRIPDDPDARREVPEIVPGDRLPRHPVVTREDESRPERWGRPHYGARRQNARDRNA